MAKKDKILHFFPHARLSLLSFGQFVSEGYGLSHQEVLAVSKSQLLSFLGGISLWSEKIKVSKHQNIYKNKQIFTA